MAQIFLTVVLILTTTFAAYLIRKFFSVKICPICLGVSFVWVVLLAARFLGIYEIDLIIPAILIGGSVVGFAYKMENHLKNKANALLWKSLFIPAGFLGAYSLIYKSAGLFLFSAFIVFVLPAFFLTVYSKKEKEISKTAVDLKNKMKNCC